ncbi:MAG TPA: TolC family protein [Bacteroidota bacterium]|nr:TolC family protein [Bacteroidota bacterium]
MRMFIRISFYIVVLTLFRGYPEAQGQELRTALAPDRTSAASISSQDIVGSDTAHTLELFLSEALRNNPRLQAAREKARSADGRVPQAAAWDDPIVGVEYFATPVTSANPFRDGMETDYFIQQMIPFPGKKGLMRDATTAAAKMEVQSAAALERKLVAEVKTSYAMIYSTQQRIRVNEENQELLEQIVESARAKYRVGVTSQGDVLKVQVELAKLQNDQSALEQELASAVSMMNALRSVSPATSVGPLVGVVLAEYPESPESASSDALESRPEIQGMRNEVEMKEADVAASRREWFPDFMVRGMYKQMMDQTDQWAAMVGINIPLAPWGVGKYTGKVEENEASLRSSEQSLLEMQNMVQAQVRDAHAKVRSGWERLDRYRETILPQAEEAFQSTLAAYQIDAADFLSLLDSYRMLQMLKMEYYMVEAEYASNLASLEQAIGRNLE